MQLNAAIYGNDEAAAALQGLLQEGQCKKALEYLEHTVKGLEAKFHSSVIPNRFLPQPGG